MKIPENRTPMGLFKPRSATEIPVNPSEGSTSLISICFPVPARNKRPPASPAMAPAITMERIMLFFSLIPAYLLASRLKPTAFNSYPNVVLFKITQIRITTRIAIKIPPFTLEPGKILSRPILGILAVFATFLDSFLKLLNSGL